VEVGGVQRGAADGLPPAHQYTFTSHSGQCARGAASPESTYSASAATPASSEATRAKHPPVRDAAGYLMWSCGVQR
jgi:hypothetical protein